MLIITIMMQLRLLLKKLEVYCASALLFCSKNAKKLCKKHNQNSDAEMVYDIFIHYFSDRLGVSPNSVIDQEYTERILIKQGMEERL